MSAEVISKELDYSSPVNNHSTVIYRSVAPQGSSSVTTSITSTVGPTTFIIPPAPFNFAKSRLNFTLDLAAGGVGKFNFVSGNLLSAISRITLYDSATNALWCDISNVPYYAAAVVPATTDFVSYSTKAYVNALATTPAPSRLNTVEDISKSNVLVHNDTGLNADLALENPYFSRRQFYIGATNTRTCIDVSLPLSAFKMSILSSDKLYYCPSNLSMDVYFSANNDYAFLTEDAENPTQNESALATAIAISNLSLNLAGEANLAITSKLIDTVMSKGLSLPFAYPTVTRQTLAGATAHSYQLSITKGYGSRILAFYTVPFNEGADVNARTVHRRGDITFINTLLNNVPIKRPQGFNCLASEDYMLANRNYLYGSVVQTIGEYVNGEYLFIDSYCGERSMHSIDQHQVDGLDIGSAPSTWSIQVAQSVATALNYITVIVGQKILSISSQGSTVM
jgi:hypothetical protein